ncbi:ABC transporter permease [uncultured Muribaculum sp.]|uniref:ABC transporter permease n=1 Tax=uncultured Muribaculum sp. TaxID=1918613 RepID=UPI0025B2437B|nr:ABC transporter permease [uncultured Muribaculum sp.]
MFKKLFTQIKNEWRSNLWLALEMLIVSVVLWFVVDYFYVTIYNYNLPRGFDTSNCYRIGVAQLTDKSPEYIPNRSDDEILQDRETLLSRIRMRPEVEFVSVSNNSHPYNGSNSGTSIRYDTLYPRNFAVHRNVTPDFVQVFRYEGARGETPAQLAEMLNRGEVLISDNLFMYDGVKGVDIVGKGLYLYGDTSRTYRIGASLNEVQYNDYGGWGDDLTLVTSRDALGYGHEWCVRVKEGYDKDFIKNFMDDADRLYRVGNFYITDVKSFDQIRDNYQRSYTNQIRNFCVGMGFLLLNIFLGLLGTFWFRTQQRVSEIAIRMVNGATRSSIFGRLIGEGLLILTVVTVVAIGFDILISYLELNQWLNGNKYLSWGRTSLCVLISYVLMAIMISVGIAFPAYRAMHIQPTEALHDE